MAFRSLYAVKRYQRHLLATIEINGLEAPIKQKAQHNRGRPQISCFQLRPNDGAESYKSCWPLLKKLVWSPYLVPIWNYAFYFVSDSSEVINLLFFSFHKILLKFSYISRFVRFSSQYG